MADAALAQTTDFRRISASEPQFGQIVDFLTDEAMLLDDDRYNDWLALLTDDVTYRMPQRQTLYRRDGKGFDERVSIFDDERMTLAMRVRRAMEAPSAYDRDPLPRMRRLVSNIVVHETEVKNEYAVRSAILLLRNRFAATRFDMLSALREDIIRKTDEGLRLARRLILVDQSFLDNTYISVFL